MSNITPIYLDRSYYVNAVWDEEAGIYHSRSNIKGLYIEALNLQLFRTLVRYQVAEAIMDNHLIQGDSNV